MCGQNHFIVRERDVVFDYYISFLVVETFKIEPQSCWKFDSLP